MLFNSEAFLLVFLPLVLGGWWGLRSRTRLRFAFLALSSWVFYAYFDVRFLAILVAVTFIDYGFGGAIHRSQDERRRKQLLIAALIVNLGLLCTFKYAGYAFERADTALDRAGLGLDLPNLYLALPIGISFYVLNSISYTIDIYRRRVEPATDILRYASFVALFPHLIAGPIVRYADIETQLRSPRVRLATDVAYRAATLFAIGLFKKVIVADQLAPTVEELFRSPESLTLLTAWAASVGFLVQLYFDFSGYSDMAVGLALMLGFRFPQNFNSPLTAVNVSDFWRRWHITLSRFFRDYVYIPLGGSRRGAARTVRNLLVTMGLAGLWHGAGTPFLLFGLFIGVLLAGHSLLRARGLTPRSTVLNRLLTFLAMVVAFVFFRSPTMAVAFDVFTGMGGLNGLGSWDGLIDATSLSFVLGLLALLVFVNIAPNSWEVCERLTGRSREVFAVGTLAGVALMGIPDPTPFLYFQF